MHYKIGTRGSMLALTQTEIVKNKLENQFPEDSFEIKVIKTTGDKNQIQSLEEIGSKGVFTDEIERELLTGEIALAVHSMKDMPSEIDERLAFAKSWDREDPRDVLILREGKSLEDLPKGAVIGTGSKRRAYQVQMLRPDLKTVGIRGNVDTRIKKLFDPAEGLDAIIIAAAGLKRLHRESEVSQYFTEVEMIPAPTQGILALEVKADNKDLLDKLNTLSDEEVDFAAQLERSFLQKIGGDCHYPIGAYYDQKGKFYSLFGEQDGSRLARVERTIESHEIDIDQFMDDVVAEMKEKLDGR